MSDMKPYMIGIPWRWKQAVQNMEVQLVDPTKPQYDDPYDSPEYAAFVESMAQHCHCEPIGNRPCDGVLAGGLCDGMDWTERHRDYDHDE